jgi:hypothetical protein
MKSRIAVLSATLAIALTSIAAPIASAATPTGTAGGGNCSAWASIKEAMFGVHCGYFMQS